jgi:cytochrome P450
MRLAGTFFTAMVASARAASASSAMTLPSAFVVGPDSCHTVSRTPGCSSPPASPRFESTPPGSKVSATRISALPAAASASGVVSAASRILFGADPAAARPLSVLFRLTALVFTTLLVLSSRLRRKVLFPGSGADPSHSEPLPEGSLGCPLFGKPIFHADKQYGAGAFYRDNAASLGNPRVWKYYFMGKPFAVISGGENLKSALNLEFDTLTSSGAEIMEGGLLPIKSILFEPDKSRHAFLRRLVGQSLTPARVSEAVPVLQEAADVAVDKMLAIQDVDGKVTMEKICTDFTLDVAWRQILGLNLSEEEIPEFEKEVETWSTGIMSKRALFGLSRFSPGYKARENIIEKIVERIESLERNGPDASNLSGMLFAKDEEDPTKTLSREEIIDNALILIFAGSETSASTLTNAMLFCGLNRRTWDKLVAEQMKMKEKYGDVLTKQSLDDECPYLDAVIKESLRLRAVSGGMPRKVAKTLVIDGKQIPKGWFVDPQLGITHENDPKTKRMAISNVDPYQGFVPERWLDPKTAPDTDFVPFGAGPRFCLGYQLALCEMKVFLATIARKIDYKLIKEYDGAVEWDTKMSVIPQPADGVEISVREVVHS